MEVRLDPLLNVPLADLQLQSQHTLALRDLLQYYDASSLPDDPLLKARCCAKVD